MANTPYADLLHAASSALSDHSATPPQNDRTSISLCIPGKGTMLLTVEAVDPFGGYDVTVQLGDTSYTGNTTSDAHKAILQKITTRALGI